MSDHGLTKENLLRILPPALTHDKSVMALAEAAAEVLAARLAEIDRARIIPNIDALDEAVLDLLARDFKVDWWDPDYTLEEKRRTLKDSWRVHKLLGTKAAVETAISAIYPETKIYEWWEYDGEPYHFRLMINANYENVAPEKHQRVLERMRYYKNLRSHSDGIYYFMKPPEPATAHVWAGGPGIREVMAAVVTAPPPVKPRGKARGGAAFGLCSCHMRMKAVVAMPEHIKTLQEVSI